VRAQEAEIRRVQAEFFPKVFVAGDLGQNIRRVRTSDIPGWSTVNDVTYGAAIFIEIPLFDGGLLSNRVGVARSQLKVAEDELELTRDKAARQEVRAYEELKVALRQREAAVAFGDRVCNFGQLNGVSCRAQAMKRRTTRRRRAPQRLQASR
jgi:outer membrane protein TolC